MFSLASQEDGFSRGRVSLLPEGRDLTVVAERVRRELAGNFPRQKFCIKSDLGAILVANTKVVSLVRP